MQNRFHFVLISVFFKLFLSFIIRTVGMSATGFPVCGADAVHHIGSVSVTGCGASSLPTDYLGACTRGPRLPLTIAKLR